MNADRTMNTLILCLCPFLYWMLCFSIIGPMQIGPAGWNILMTETFVLSPSIIGLVYAWQVKSAAKPFNGAGIVLFSCLMISPGVVITYLLLSGLAVAHGGR